jgi:hypothetical protein
MSWTPRSSLQRKLVWIYLPWMLAMVLGGVGWAALAHWFFIEEGNYLVDKGTLLFSGLVVQAVYAWFVLRPRFRLLDLGEQDGQTWLAVYYMVAGFGILFSMWLCLGFVDSTAGHERTLARLDEINQPPSVQFYQLPAYRLDSQHLVRQTTLLQVAEGRARRKVWKVSHCIAMPILDVVADTTDSVCAAWLCRTYQRDIASELPMDHVDSLVAELERNSIARFMRYATGDFVFLERVTIPEETAGLETAIGHSTRYPTQPHALLQGVGKPLDWRKRQAIIEVLALWILSGLVALGMVMLPDWNAAELKRFLERRR